MSQYEPTQYPTMLPTDEPANSKVDQHGKDGKGGNNNTNIMDDYFVIIIVIVSVLIAFCAIVAVLNVPS